MSATAIFNGSVAVAGFGPLVGMLLHFSYSKYVMNVGDTAVEVVGILQGVAVEKDSQGERLQFYFFNQPHEVRTGGTYTITPVES